MYLRFIRQACGLAALLILFAAPASSQTMTTSVRPDRVAVTVYRATGRDVGTPMDLSWLGGFAFISEVRQVSIPAGEAEIRFEGVAGGIIPQSAIVTGLPEGVLEKNRDAHLLSPASLLDGSLGKRVHIRRTSAATGKVDEQDAIMRTGADGALVVQTAAGFEALRCTGLPETIVYGELPPGLSAKPTLSVRTRSSRPITATVTLSYLASGFDWQANYVATLSLEEDRLDLFAWVTLASSDETSFVDAQAQAVAGRLNRRNDDANDTDASEDSLTLRCWPFATTSDIPLEELPQLPLGSFGLARDEVVITAQRKAGALMNAPMALAPISAEQVSQEELGDLKLYRIPHPVTVASNSQKQVALMAREGVKAEVFYRTQVHSVPRGTTSFAPLRIVKLRNRVADGPGLPLPRGQVALFATGAARPVLIGQGAVDDKALNEDVEIAFPAPPGVSAGL